MRQRPDGERTPLDPVPLDAPIGTRVLVVEDGRTITVCRTRSLPWELAAVPPMPPTQVVLLTGRNGSYLLTRCFLPPPEWR